MAEGCRIVPSEMKPGDIFGSTWDDGTESVCIVRSADDGRIVGFALIGYDCLAFDSETGQFDNDASACCGPDDDCRITFVGPLPTDIEHGLRDLHSLLLAHESSCGWLPVYYPDAPGDHITHAIRHMDTCRGRVSPQEALPVRRF